MQAQAKGSYLFLFPVLVVMFAFALQQVKTKTKYHSDISQVQDIYHTWLCLATENTGSRLPKCSDDFACACVCVEFRLSLESSLLLTSVKTRFYCKVLNVSSGERLVVHHDGLLEIERKQFQCFWVKHGLGSLKILRRRRRGQKWFKNRICFLDMNLAIL